MAWNVTLDGVPTEDATLGYNSNAPMEWAVIGQRWQASADGITWTDISGATQETFIPSDAEAGMSLRVVVLYEDQFGEGQTASSDGEDVVNVNDLPQGDVTIVGTARQGEALFAVDAVADDDGTQNAAFSYRWQVETAPGAWTDIAGATEVFFNLTQAEVGRAVRAVVSYIDDQGTPETVASAPTLAVEDTNDAPNGSVTLTGSARQGQTLSLLDGVTDEDGIAAGARAYKWQVGSSPGAWADIAGANGATFTLTQAEVGHAVRAVLSYTDGLGAAGTVESEPTLAVENVDDEPGGALAVVGTAKQGEVLSLVDTVTDADGMQNAIREYQWQVRDGAGDWTDIAGATAATFSLTQAEVGRSVRAVLAYQDDHGQWETPATGGTPLIENVNDEPQGAVLVAGTARQGQTLTAAASVTDADGYQAADGTYKWQVADGNGGWTDIAGAADETFTLTQAEVGRAVRGVVRYIDGNGTPETFASAATAAVENADDAPVGAPALLAGPGGAPAEDGPVTVSVAGVTDADGLGAFAYVWSREDGQGGWTVIQGADGASYSPGDADVGGRLKVEASYTDGGGAVERFTLVTASAVANANDAPTGAVALSGRTVRGETVAASTSPLADADGIGPISLRWERADGDAWTPIAGATAAAYTFGQADVGHVLRVVATWADGHGTAETVSAETGVVAARAIMLPPPESGETERDSAADEWTSTDLAGMIADGGSFAPPAGVESVRLADGVLSIGTGTAEAFLARLYLGLLGRGGDVEGLAHAGQALEDGASRADLARMFLASGEYGARHGEQTNAGFVEGLYTAFLGRGGDASERGFWTDALDGGLSRAEIAAAIAGSGEARGHMQASTTGVFVADVEGIQARSLYHCALGREADAPGLLHWSNLLGQGIDLRTLGDVFDDSAEFGARHGASSDEAFVESLYRDGAGRGADAAGLDFWVGLLASGAVGRGEVALHFSMTQEARNDLDWAL
ncbi:hypothetical protein GCM10009416_08750 [Craurococcus roseus]|uniref:DUF4214 domain-containing protein n=1 Tax=Craurococcus roseus TaxID=77585 RepID=A0ABN1ER09_9PROT